MKRARSEDDLELQTRPKRARMIIEDEGASAPYIDEFFSKDEADAYLQKLMGETPWVGETVKIFGRERPARRRTCFYGDTGVTYGYTGLKKAAAPWTATMLKIKEAVEAHEKTTFNYALLNLYVDGRDMIGWHADDETDLVPGGVIASISLGAERDFMIKKMDNAAHMLVKIALAHGSLLTMKGDMQRRYKHSVPERKKCAKARINITFRQVVVR